MTVPVLLGAAGRRRSPAIIPGYHAGRAPRNKGQLYPADPSTVEEIIAVMRQTTDDRHGARLRASVSGSGDAGLRRQCGLADACLAADDQKGALTSAQRSLAGLPF